MVFHALFTRSRRRCWKPRPEAAVFNTSLGTWRMLMHWKTMFDRYYCIKTENICYILLYFLHYFVSPFHRCLPNAISTDCARSGAGQYIPRNGSKSVAPVRSYWKLRSRALLLHGFSPVNARLLITCDTAFYAIIPLKPALGAYAASQTTVLHMKRLNQTESPIFVIFLCVLCFQRQSIWVFILLYCSWCCAVWRP